MKKSRFNKIYEELKFRLVNEELERLGHKANSTNELKKNVKKLGINVYEEVNGNKVLLCIIKQDNSALVYNIKVSNGQLYCEEKQGVVSTDKTEVN